MCGTVYHSHLWSLVSMVRVNILWCTLATWAWFVVMKVRGFVETSLTRNLQSLGIKPRLFYRRSQSYTKRKAGTTVARQLTGEQQQRNQTFRRNEVVLFFDNKK